MATVTRTVKIAEDRDARKAGSINTREWTLDFEGMTPDEVLELAADSVVIVLQRKFRKDPSTFNAATQTFMVRDAIQRSPRGPSEPLKRFLATIGIEVETEDEAREVVARMASKQRK